MSSNRRLGQCFTIYRNLAGEVVQKPLAGMSTAEVLAAIA